MKLITKFSLIYLFITTLVLGTGGVIAYVIIENEVDNEMKRQFYDRVQRISNVIEKHTADTVQNHWVEKAFKDTTYHRRGMIVRPLSYETEERVVVTDTMIWHDGLERMERSIKVGAYKQINDRSYYIASYGVFIESDDIAEAVFKTLAWIFGLQLIGAVLVGMYLSKRTFKPFYRILHKIRDFRIQHMTPIEESGGNVFEFTQLSQFIGNMTSKAVRDFKNLKEFTENASHEMQTPVAIIKTKLELLAESNLSEEQMDYVASSQRSVHTLSKLNRSLSLMSKIENEEFADVQEVDLNTKVEENLENFRELIEMRGLSVKTDLREQVVVKSDPYLIDILFSNLLSNALKHNVDEGTITVSLTNSALEISNTGNSYNGNPAELFNRFKKSDQNSSSIGLGLSIVNNIIEYNNWTINYRVEDETHRLKIQFR